MKDHSSAVLVILVLLVTLIAGGAGLYVKKRVKLELYDVNDLVYAHVEFPEIQEEPDFATSCYRVDLK